MEGLIQFTKGPSPTILFASASPRRRQLLELTGWVADWSPVDLDESNAEASSPEKIPAVLAVAKARAARHSVHHDLVIAADTVVIDEGRILGKPSDETAAIRMLQDLRGRSHRVVTAIAIHHVETGNIEVESCETSVPMRAYSDTEIEAYVRSGSPMDKAGAYGIQDNSLSPVDQGRLNGCYANVMGLPLCHLTRAMRTLGYPAQADVPAACEQETGYVCPVCWAILRGDV
ncbi:MAG: septum formation protein Maf [Anaerolineales bacterium]|nr:septum formation protein Maf [Anaerolineales bacterium]